MCAFRDLWACCCSKRTVAATADDDNYAVRIAGRKKSSAHESKVKRRKSKHYTNNHSYSHNHSHGHSHGHRVRHSVTTVDGGGGSRAATLVNEDVAEPADRARKRRSRVAYPLVGSNDDGGKVERSKSRRDVDRSNSKVDKREQHHSNGVRRSYSKKEGRVADHQPNVRRRHTTAGGSCSGYRHRTSTSPEAMCLSLVARAGLDLPDQQRKRHTSVPPEFVRSSREVSPEATRADGRHKLEQVATIVSPATRHSRRKSRDAVELAMSQHQPAEGERLKIVTGNHRAGYQQHSASSLVATPMTADLMEASRSNSVVNLPVDRTAGTTFDINNLSALAEIAVRENALVLSSPPMSPPAPGGGQGGGPATQRRHKSSRRSSRTYAAPPQPSVSFHYDETALLPRTEADWRAHLIKHVTTKGLTTLLPPTSKNISEISTLAATQGASIARSLVLSPHATRDLATIGLYDVIIFADDSSSMYTEDRWHALFTVVQHMAILASRYNPAGVSLRFINFRNDSGFNGISTPAQVDTCLGAVEPNGMTQLGTRLLEKVVVPLIINPARTHMLQRPVVVSVITDGEPTEEDPDTLRNTILAAKNELRKLGYGPGAVVFQISRVGGGNDARDFVKRLQRDRQLVGLVFCTDETVDGAVTSAKDRGELNTWLAQLLAGAVKR